MSFALRLGGDAVADLRHLDPWLAETVLDELEVLSADPSQLRLDARGEAVHDFERQLAEIRHLVFLRIQLDLHRRTLTVFTIIDVPRP